MQTYKKKTFSNRKEDVKRQWRLVDADNRVLGQLASEIAQVLMGKDKPTYTPHIDGGDYVVLVNAGKMILTGNKQEKKLYIRHSNYPGGLKSETFAKLLKRRPEAIIRSAVKGMLPDNRLRDGRLSRLKVFAGSEHTYGNYIKEEK